jgi:ribosomal protein L7/L12
MKLVQNSAGRWIDKQTGHFVKKETAQKHIQRLENLEKARTVKAQKSVERKARKETISQNIKAGIKEYWKDVKTIRELTGKTLKDAKKYVHDSKKYVEKRGHKAFQWKEFWKNVKKNKMDELDRKMYKMKLEEEGFELITY